MLYVSPPFIDKLLEAKSSSCNNSRISNIVSLALSTASSVCSEFCSVDEESEFAGEDGGGAVEFCTEGCAEFWSVCTDCGCDAVGDVELACV